jgi:mRNA interferase MazF
VRRGELWTSAGGAPYADKPRPALIVQSDQYEATGSVAICGLTTDSTETTFTRPLIVPADSNGLREPSRVMVDKITTVPRERLRQRIGALSDDDILEVEIALALFLDL